MGDTGGACRVDSCRVDVWLWRARFAKTRSLAAALVERGAVRLTHQGRQVRLVMGSFGLQRVKLYRLKQ